MPMVKVRLSCGCVQITHYRGRTAWDALPTAERDTVVKAVIDSHVGQCRQRKPAPAAAKAEDATDD